jgi:uncharacterized membrane protein (DUF4010 family)
MPVPALTNVALLLGLSFFFGLAFEDFYSRRGEARPGGVRTFPLLAIIGGVLYLLDPTHIAVAAGVVVLGAWLFAYYRATLAERAENIPNRGELIVPVSNLLAYLLGPIALAAPTWLAIGVTVAAVLLLAERERLHRLAERLELRELVIAGQFLILTGLILPLLPDEPVTPLTTITPYKAWLALLAVCTISYASYLLGRYVAPKAGDLWIAALGGLYSSTATTIVLARRAAAGGESPRGALAGITLATSFMFPRVLAVVAVFNRPLALALAPGLLVPFALGLVLAFVQYRRGGPLSDEDLRHDGVDEARNPLELSAAALFAVLFVVISIASSWVKEHFGTVGIDVLAAVVGVTDIDPFVLSLAQGVAAPLPVQTAAAAVLIATASNNFLKAGYAASFMGLRESLPAVGSLILLAFAALAIALAMILANG